MLTHASIRFQKLPILNVGLLTPSMPECQAVFYIKNVIKKIIWNSCPSLTDRVFCFNFGYILCLFPNTPPEAALGKDPSAMEKARQFGRKPVNTCAKISALPRPNMSTFLIC
ncbi:MAG: hypothetical protein DRI57_18855 [Deltaproteobacteria bacterium]|nr:MAG: hypothetical protein DRI57_18855 [Deltaproteobacteria bacterium]